MIKRDPLVLLQPDSLVSVQVGDFRSVMLELVCTEAGPIEHWLLTHPRVKHWVRAFYSIRSVIRLKRASRRGVVSHKDYRQAGKSVAGVNAVEPVAEIVERWTARQR